MLTLHSTTELAKSIAKWGGIILGGILLIILLFRGGAFIMRTFFPKPSPPPEVKFGKLPAILFPQSVVSQKFSYQLDTVSGGLGNFSDRAKVYKTVRVEPNLLDLRLTRQAALSTKFTRNETYLTDTLYSWSDEDRPDKKLQINIVSKDFTIISNYFSYPEFQQEIILDQKQAVDTATQFLTKFGLYPMDIDPNKTTTQLLSIQGTSLFAATSLSTAQLIRVDFFQNSLDKLPIMYPHPPNSTMHIIVGGENTNEIFEARFMHQSTSNESSTYPMRTVTQAYELLKQNKAYIGSYFGTNNTITIKDVYLGYFIGEEKQDYIMPVYVFEGKDGFFAYVSAVSDSWIIH